MGLLALCFFGGFLSEVNNFLKYYVYVGEGRSSTNSSLIAFTNVLTVLRT